MSDLSWEAQVAALNAAVSDPRPFKPPVPRDEPFYTVPELARFLGVPRAFVLRLLGDGEIRPHGRPGLGACAYADEVERYIDRCSDPSNWADPGPEPLRRISYNQWAEHERDYAVVLRGDPCSYCGAPAEHVDHIIPLAQGGPHDWSNFTGACARCNIRKRTSPLLGFLLRTASLP